MLSIKTAKPTKYFSPSYNTKIYCKSFLQQYYNFLHTCAPTSRICNIANILFYFVRKSVAIIQKHISYYIICRMHMMKSNYFEIIFTGVYLKFT